MVGKAVVPTPLPHTPAARMTVVTQHPQTGLIIVNVYCPWPTVAVSFNPCLMLTIAAELVACLLDAYRWALAHSFTVGT